MVIGDRTDGEARAQIGGALLIGDRLVPDVHAPVVRRDIEQPGLARIGHRHPVLAAQKRRRGEHRLALFRAGRIAGAVIVVIVGAARLGVDAVGPGGFHHEFIRRNELAGVAVQNIEITVTVSLGTQLHRLAVDSGVEGDELVHAVEVPAVMRGGLIVPLDDAGVGIDRQRAAGIEVVAGAHVAVPGAGVAGAHEDQVAVGVIGTAEPCRAATRFPHIAGPAGVQLAGHAVGLAVQRADVAFDGRAAPYQLAGVDVEGLDLTDDTEFTAGVAVDHQILYDHRRGSGRNAGLIVADHLVPDHLAGVAVQRDQMRVEGGKNDFVAVDRGAAVDHVTAGHDAIWKARVIFPLLLAGVGVKGENAAVRTCDIDRAVINQRL